MGTVAITITENFDLCTEYVPHVGRCYQPRSEKVTYRQCHKETARKGRFFVRIVREDHDVEGRVDKDY